MTRPAPTHVARRRIAATLALPAAIALASSSAWAQAGEPSPPAPSQLEQRDATIARLEARVADLAARLEELEAILQGTGAPTPGETVPLPSAPLLQQGVRPPVAAAAPGGDFEVDELAAERALERVLSQDGALLLAAGSVEVSPAFTWSRIERAYPVGRIEEDRVLLGENAVSSNIYSLNLDVRVGGPWGTQLELGMPYRWSDTEVVTSSGGVPLAASDGGSSSGFGNLRVGLAKTLVRESGWRPDIVGRVTWETGLGGDEPGATPDLASEALSGSLTFVKRADPLVLIGTTSYRTTLGDEGLVSGDQFGFSLGTAFAASPHTTLFATVSNQFVSEAEFNGEPLAGSDLTATSLNLGLGTIVGRGLLMNVVTGIGITEDAPDFSLGVSASVRIR